MASRSGTETSSASCSCSACHRGSHCTADSSSITNITTSSSSGRSTRCSCSECLMVNGCQHSTACSCSSTCTCSCHESAVYTATDGDSCSCSASARHSHQLGTSRTPRFLVDGVGVLEFPRLLQLPLLPESSSAEWLTLHHAIAPPALPPIGAGKADATQRGMLPNSSSGHDVATCTSPIDFPLGPGVESQSRIAHTLPQLVDNSSQWSFHDAIVSAAHAATSTENYHVEVVSRETQTAKEPVDDRVILHHEHRVEQLLTSEEALRAGIASEAVMSIWNDAWTAMGAIMHLTRQQRVESSGLVPAVDGYPLAPCTDDVQAGGDALLVTSGSCMDPTPADVSANSNNIEHLLNELQQQESTDRYTSIVEPQQANFCAMVVEETRARTRLYVGALHREYEKTNHAMELAVARYQADASEARATTAQLQTVVAQFQLQFATQRANAAPCAVPKPATGMTVSDGCGARSGILEHVDCNEPVHVRFARVAATVGKNHLAQPNGGAFKR